MNKHLKELIEKYEGYEFYITHLGHRIYLQIKDGCLNYWTKKKWTKAYTGAISQLYINKIEEALS